ncbi:MAG TPA: hypothetical protein VMU67_10995 [Steroidobacteraceae bacterium]|nr:hypothetical protein [Steroidobacteraceae bacterium]
MKSRVRSKPVGVEAQVPSEEQELAAGAARATLRVEVARQNVRLAKEEVKRARKRYKEAKREAKRARKRAQAARKAWKQVRRRGKHKPRPHKRPGRSAARARPAGQPKAAAAE